jgi:hypothetical protein
MDCIWLVDKLIFEYEQDGKCVGAWMNYENIDHEYCGREILFPDTWTTNE